METAYRALLMNKAIEEVNKTNSSTIKTQKRAQLHKSTSISETYPPWRHGSSFLEQIEEMSPTMLVIVSSAVVLLLLLIFAIVKSRNDGYKAFGDKSGLSTSSS